MISLSPARAVERDVSSEAELEAAIAAAQPGDQIVLADGDYASTGITCSAAGSAAAPIVVRARNRLGARITMNALEGFHVVAPDWRFDGLDVRGVCANDSDCEHAFHVVGAAVGFQLANCRLHDFNAPLKVNNDGTTYPDDGLVEHCEVFDSRPRATSNPVTGLNINEGSRWIVRGNYVHDIHRVDTTTATYEAFMKGGSSSGVFERNLIVCSANLADTSGVNVGLSFGGGGTDPQYCVQPNSPGPDSNCTFEHHDGVMRNNIIANCSDVGIYLNEAANSHILYNTLVHTAGIDFRFSSSSGESRGNLLAGAIHPRDGGSFTSVEDTTGVSDASFVAMYQDPLRGDLRIKGDLSAILKMATPVALVLDDYCGRARGAAPWDRGALESSLGDCDTRFDPSASGVDGGAPAPGGDMSGGGGADMSMSMSGSRGGDMSGGSGGAGGAVGKSAHGCDFGGGAAPSGAALLAFVSLLLARATTRARPRRRSRRSLNRTRRR